MKNLDGNYWYDVGDRRAAEKVSQALREKSQEEKKAKLKKEEEQARADDPSSNEAINSLLSGDVQINTVDATAVVNPHSGGPAVASFPTLYGTAPPPEYRMVYNLDSDNLSFPVPFSPFPSNSLAASPRLGALTDTPANFPSSSSERDGDNESNAQRYPVKGGVFGSRDVAGNIIVTDHDILCGRGGATNHHKVNLCPLISALSLVSKTVLKYMLYLLSTSKGNKRFRDIVAVHRPDYIRATKVQKPDVSRLIVKAIRSGNPPGRFLKKDDDGNWFDIGDKRATEKASQALREKVQDEKPAGRVCVHGVTIADVTVNDETTTVSVSTINPLSSSVSQSISPIARKNVQGLVNGDSTGASSHQGGCEHSRLSLVQEQPSRRDGTPDLKRCNVEEV